MTTAIFYHMQMLSRHMEHLGEQTNLLLILRRKSLHPCNLVVVLDLLNKIVGQFHLFLAHDDTSMLDIAAIEPMQVIIEVECCCKGILPQLVLDEEVHLLKFFLTALELKQFLHTENVAALEHRLCSIIDHHIAIR